MAARRRERSEQNALLRLARSGAHVRPGRDRSGTTVLAPRRKAASVGSIRHNPSVPVDLVGAARVTPTALSLLGRVRGVLAAARRKAGELESARELLGLAEPGSFSYRVGDHHPIYNVGDPHPDDRAAFAAVLGSVVSPSLLAGDVGFQDRIPCRLDDGLVLIGSPEVEPVARLAFGYRDAGEFGMQYDGDTIDLPFRWEEDERVVQASYARFVAGRGLVTRPNWPIVDNTGDAPRHRYPQLDRDNLSLNDWLVVTRLPNITSRHALQSGRSLVSIAGSHGTATRAIELLLRDSGALRALARAVPPGVDGFQALVGVGDIVHDPERGSYARRIRLEAVHPITRSAFVWEEAVAAVERRYADWLSDVTANPPTPLPPTADALGAP